jgi:hypothetical protein
MEARPLARTLNLEIEDLGDDVLVYDTDRDVAHALNRTAALVWRGSDGRRTVPDLVALLGDELGEMADEDLVLITLDRLKENGLIDTGYRLRDPQAERVSRRRFIRRGTAVGAAVLALPAVQSVVAPTPAAAQSPPPSGTPGPTGLPGPTGPPGPSGPPGESG